MTVIGVVCREDAPQVTSLQALLLKFPTIGEGMKAADYVFDQLDTNEDGFIDMDEWKAGRQLLQLPETPGVLEKEFSSSLMHGDTVCHRDEFLVLLAIMHVLEKTDLPDQLDKAFLILEAVRALLAQCGPLGHAQWHAGLHAGRSRGHSVGYST